MFKEVVVLLDGSVAAEQALDAALPAVIGYGAHLILARIVGPVAPRGPIPPELSRLDARHLEQAAEYLEGVRRRLVQQYGVEPETKTILGDLYESVAELAQGEGRLLVLTSHGAGGATQRRYGSVARYALDHCRCAVLVVRVSDRHGRPRTYEEAALAGPVPAPRR
jgi:nucleotide-binding universal stress UspA family protein